MKRATLHNFDEIKRLDIMINDTVFVQKAAEIIPKVVSVDMTKRDNQQIPINIPENCPVCGSEVLVDNLLVAIKCPNNYCSERIIKSIEYFTSRDCMNIKGLGEKINRKLIEMGFITNILDLYNLSAFRSQIVVLEKMGEKNTDNLLNSIEKSKTNSYQKVLYSLGIPFVGKNTASILCYNFSNIDLLANAKIEDIENIKGLGSKVAESVVNFFSNDTNKRIIASLKEIGFKLENEIREIKFNENITNKSFLATGTLEKYTRDQVKDIILSYGGKYLSSVSKNLDYLIVGNNAGSKLQKAQKLNINILTEDEFIKMIGGI